MSEALKIQAPESVLKKAAQIKLLLMDCDGVMTDGLIYFFPDSKGQMTEFKGFNSQDGLGLHFFHKCGLKSGIISGRDSPAVTERARILGMDYVYQGLLAKTQAYEEILKDCGYTPEQTAFIGDDFTDIPVMKRSGLAIAVKNARPEVIASSHHVTEVDGGAGAVREAVELILKAQGLWSKILNQYEISQL